MTSQMPGPIPGPTPGYRRRILIEPASGCVTAELEDDWHRMVVTLHHAEGTIIRAISQMKRAPWTACPGAMQRLQATFEGVSLADVVRRGEKTANCTHLYDLVLFAASHADMTAPTAYDVRVSDPVDGQREASIRRNDVTVLGWSLREDRLVAPPALEGRRLTELGDWIASLDRAGQEAARVLRWATIMSFGRQMTIAAHSPASRFANGACFTFQPEQAAAATRMPGADQDFSLPGAMPLADRP